MHPTEHRSFAAADEVPAFANRGVEILKIGGANTEGCLPPHPQYHPSAQLAICMDDGNVFVAAPGDIMSPPIGHPASVATDEPVGTVGRFAPSNDAR
ncbi:MAG: cupin [Acidimicrobiales bacterium]|jgi:hypothetical protein